MLPIGSAGRPGRPSFAEKDIDDMFYNLENVEIMQAPDFNIRRVAYSKRTKNLWFSIHEGRDKGMDW